MDLFNAAKYTEVKFIILHYGNFTFNLSALNHDSYDRSKVTLHISVGPPGIGGDYSRIPF